LNFIVVHFFDTARLRDKPSTINKEQQRRNRVSAIPISTRYLSSNNIKTNSSLLSSRPTYRRPVSLFVDDQYSTNQTSQTRHSQRTASPPSSTHRYTLAISPESTTTTSTPSRYLISSDLDSTLKDLKCKEIYKYTRPSTTVAPSVFTTSAIKFAPAPTRRMSPSRDQENSSTRLDDNINTTTNNNNNNRHSSLLTSLELPTTYKSRLLDDNNNLVSLKVYE